MSAPIGWYSVVYITRPEMQQHREDFMNEKKAFDHIEESTNTDGVYRNSAFTSATEAFLEASDILRFMKRISTGRDKQLTDNLDSLLTDMRSTLRTAEREVLFEGCTKVVLQYPSCFSQYQSSTSVSQRLSLEQQTKNAKASNLILDETLKTALETEALGRATALDIQQQTEQLRRMKSQTIDIRLLLDASKGTLQRMNRWFHW
ncbi:vesicle transport v-snare protein [Planoprotostelium fungivorum]|uniref:Vesicle transport v-snare protein n=1 Tax=Planoprotostelium fungivorum TaxID=1890364 RepID=A0A2P6P0W2_9EUKA|nr:vesicle transport v-snare protein [Planoprotostelium fungivorum]